MLTLAIAKQKGGVAKTSLTGNLGVEFAAGGKRVVLVDLDPQPTLTTWVLGHTDAPGTAETLPGEEKAAPVIIDAPAIGVDLIAAVPDRLRVAERTLSAQVASERTLGKGLRCLDVDVIYRLSALYGRPHGVCPRCRTSGVVIPLAAATKALEGCV